ncbi:hypothetical protein VCHA44O286_50330 [Vibrio chagasii]|nr:hypothetical protein VCHA44O286_50330 [Vibrio chagasii]
MRQVKILIQWLKLLAVTATPGLVVLGLLVLKSGSPTFFVQNPAFALAVGIITGVMCSPVVICAFGSNRAKLAIKLDIEEGVYSG